MASVGRQVKESIVQELSTELSKRPNVFVTAINRLPGSDTDALRRKLYASHAHLIMVSRRLGRRAIEPLKIAGLAELLEGSVGLVLAGEDALPTAKLLIELRKAHEEGLSVRGAVIDGRLLDEGTVEQLASLPPKPVLLAQLVATIESPIAELMMTLERLIGDLAWVVEQAAEKKPVPAPQGDGQAGAEPDPSAAAPSAPPEAGTPPTGGVADGSAERRSRRPPAPAGEASQPPSAPPGGSGGDTAAPGGT